VLNVVTGGAGYTLAISGLSGNGVITVEGTAPTTFSGIEEIQLDGAP
jgi:hypothetical protein